MVAAIMSPFCLGITCLSLQSSHVLGWPWNSHQSNACSERRIKVKVDHFLPPLETPFMALCCSPNKDTCP